MILRPDSEDYKIIGYYLGKIIIGIGILMVIPLGLAFFYSELAPTIDYLFSISLTLLIGLGVIVEIFQWWVFLLFAVVYLLIYFPQVRSEENMLWRRFDKEYNSYCKATPRYFPKLFIKIKVIFRCLRFKWEWIKSERVSLIGTLGLVMFAEAWKDMRLFGWKGYLNEISEFIATVAIVIAGIILLFHEKENYKRI